MMNQAISHRCFVNNTRLGVGDMKRVILAVTIGFICQVIAKYKNVVGKVELEILYVSSCSLAPQKFRPGVE